MERALEAAALERHLRARPRAGKRRRHRLPARRGFRFRALGYAARDGDQGRPPAADQLALRGRHMALRERHAAIQQSGSDRCTGTARRSRYASLLMRVIVLILLAFAILWLILGFAARATVDRALEKPWPDRKSTRL